MIFQDMNLPEKAKVNSIIYKKQIYENANLIKVEKDIIKNDIEKIIWEYSLKENTINIEKYVDDEVEYLEVDFITVVLRNAKHYNQIFEIIQKSIPYPLVLVAEIKNDFYVNCALKRINKSDKIKLVIEKTFSTEKINLNELDERFYEFLERIKIENLSFLNFFMLYQGICDKIVEYNLSFYTGKYEELKNSKETVVRLEKIRELEEKINVLKNKVKKENQMNKRVEMNMKLKELKKELKNLLNHE